MAGGNRHGRVRLISVAATWLALSGAGAASAQESAASDEPRLEWMAPAGCSSRAEVLDQVAALAAQDEVLWSRFEVIRARVTFEGSRWKLALEFEGQGDVRRRALVGGSCSELAQAAAVAIVLAHRRGKDEDAGVTQALPEAVVSAPANETDMTGGGRSAALSDASDARLGLSVDLEAAIDPATLGSAALGGAVGIELRLGSLGAALYAAGFPAVAVELGNEQAVEVGLWTSGLRACQRWGRGLDTCALMELGRVSAEGVGLIDASEGGDLWAAPGLSLALTSTPFDGFGIITRLSAVHPLVRGRFRVDESNIVHRIPVVGFRASLGVDVPLL